MGPLMAVFCCTLDSVSTKSSSLTFSLPSFHQFSSPPL